MNKGFELLIQFKMLVKNIPPLSYSQHNEMEVLTKEMVMYEYPLTTQWVNIVKFRKKLLVFLVNIPYFFNVISKVYVTKFIFFIFYFIFRIIDRVLILKDGKEIERCNVYKDCQT